MMKEKKRILIYKVLICLMYVLLIYYACMSVWHEEIIFTLVLCVVMCRFGQEICIFQTALRERFVTIVSMVNCPHHVYAMTNSCITSKKKHI